MFSKRVRSAINQGIVALVIAALTVPNPAFVQVVSASSSGDVWGTAPESAKADSADEESLSGDTWKTDPSTDHSQREEKGWNGDSDLPRTSGEGTDYSWGDNPQRNTYSNEGAAWKNAPKRTEKGSEEVRESAEDIESTDGFSLDENNDGVMNYGDGQSMSRDDLYGGRGGDASARGSYGSLDTMKNSGRQARQGLENDSSPSGQAYRIFESGADRARPDFMSDPAFDLSSEVLGSTMDGRQLECEEDGAVTYEECRRNFDPNLPQGCGFDRNADTREWSKKQRVFSYKGCHDHNYIYIQVADAPAKRFNAPGGYFAREGVNPIDPQWEGDFVVESNRGGSDIYQDVFSGILYDFNPISSSELEGRSIDSISVNVTNVSTRNNADFKSKILRQPRASNNWTLKLRLDDAGTSGGNPGCPKGRSNGHMGWAEFDLELEIEGVELIEDRWTEKNSACEIADREYGDLCSKEFFCDDDGGNPGCITVDGHQFCSNLTNPPVEDIPRGCTDIRQEWNCDFPGASAPDTCEPLDEDPDCGFVGSECAPGAYDEGEERGEDFVPRMEKNVYSFAGCHDHNRVAVQIAGVPTRSFDSRGDAGNPGYAVLPTLRNRVDELWGGSFNVQSLHSGGPSDNMSGVFYRFNPYDLSDVEGMTKDEIDVSIVNRISRNNAPFSYNLVQKPGPSNNWTVIFDINDNGERNGAPGCPHGPDAEALGWSQFDIRVGFGSDDPVAEDRCYAWNDVYKCQSPGNDAACAAQDLMGQDFAECETEVVTSEVETVTDLSVTETCQIPRQITSCEVEREVEIQPVEDSGSSSVSGCFDTSRRTLYPGWGDRYMNVSADINFSNMDNVSGSIEEHPNYGNDFSVTVEFSGGENDEGECPEDTSYSGRVDVDWSGNRVTTDLNWDPAEDFNNPCLKGDDGISIANGQCTDSTGITVPSYMSSHIENMYEGDPTSGTLCEDAYIEYSPSNPGDKTFCSGGAAGCSTGDPETALAEERAKCDALDNRDDCELDREQVIGSGSGSTGIQYFFERVYECQNPDYGGKTITETTETEVYQCNADVSCMGEECTNIEREKSGQFEKAVGMLNMLDSAKHDTTCDSDNPSSCEVFPGEPMECKVALGNLSSVGLDADCCNVPEGVSLRDYLNMIKATRKLDSIVMATENAGAVQGAWKTARKPIADTVNMTKDFFTSAMDNITGATEQAVTEAAEKGVVDQFKQKAMTQVSGFVKDAFGEEAAKTFFADAGTSSAALNANFASALNFISAAYTAYLIADFVISMVFACEQEEFELNQARAMQRAKYIAPYCSKDSFFGCIEEQKVFCVYNAPLPRIMQEEIRKQPHMGMSWGTAKDPNCGGIRVDKLQDVDWDEVDLSEWIDMLKATDLMPNNSKMNLERLSGDKKIIEERLETNTTVPEDQERKNVIERTTDRADLEDGHDIGEINEYHRRRNWGEQ